MSDIRSTASNAIRALDPDGSQKWSLPTDYPVVGGPAVGPEGNIYAVEEAELGGMGMCSLDSEGGLRWSETSDPEATDDETVQPCNEGIQP